MAKDEKSEGMAHVIGIGASAGGLEAIRELVRNLPVDLGASYVVVQHMSSDYRNLLRKLISRETTLTVKDVEDGAPLEPNTVFVTPSNTDVLLKDGRLKLRPPSMEPAAPKPSVNRFLISLSEDVGEKAVGVILSGTGSDGSYGIQAIRAAGGTTIAQDDTTAKYDGMPVAAMETGCVDLILSPIQIGTHLAKILSAARDFTSFRSEEIEVSPLSDLMQVVLARTRVDFREYKPTTVQRRLERRMMALGITERDEYTAFCRTNPTEVDALFKDLLISVTRFFRDRIEFDALREVIEKIVADNIGKPIRIWVAGCATGEEAYSVAMLFAQAMAEKGQLDKRMVQIFATDIDKNALDVARAGRYSIAALDDIPPYLAERYVRRTGEFIEIVPEIKDLVLFSDHNICQDPPFLHLDLVCCRNLLIYFGIALQAKVLDRLAYSLTANGTLFLGTAESATVTDELFRAVPGQKHIFRKRIGSTSKSVATQRAQYRGRVGSFARSTPIKPEVPDDGFDKTLFDELAGMLGPNGLLVSDDFHILRVYGDVSRFMALTSATRLQLTLSMLDASIGQEARTMASIALRKGSRRKNPVRVFNEDLGEMIQLEVIPLKAPKLDEGFCLVLIHTWIDEEVKERPGPQTDSANSEQIEALQAELRSSQEDLQLTIEELETANEEFQASNEELQSTNEELQATNEELETSNEELQSTNEELVTVNEELQVSKTELEVKSEEQSAVLATMATPFLIMDTALQLTTANERARDFFHIRQPHDQPHISQIQVPAGFPPLAHLCNQVLQTGETRSFDATTSSGVYSVKISPYFSLRQQVRGATLLVDRLETASKLLDSVLESTDMMPLYRTVGGEILTANDPFKANANRAIKRNTLRDLVSEETYQTFEKEDLAFLNSGKKHARKIQAVAPSDGGEERLFEVHRLLTKADLSERATILSVSFDVTERERQAEMLQAMIGSAGTMLMLRDSQGKMLAVSRGITEMMGLKPEDLVGKTVFEAFPAEAAQDYFDRDREFLESGADFFDRVFTLPDKDGNTRWIKSRRSRLLDSDRDEALIVVDGVEVTDLIHEKPKS